MLSTAIERNLERRGFELCLAVYRVTDFFPKGEALTSQLRALGNEVLAELTVGDIKKIVDKINILQRYLRVAQSQNWVSPINFIILRKAYQKLKNELLSGQVYENTIEEIKIGALKNNEVKSPANLSKIVDLQPSKDITDVEMAKSTMDSKTAKTMNRRFDKILKQLVPGRQYKIGELFEVFAKEFSERTLRNYLNDLIDQGKVGKKGEFKKTIYFLKQ